MLNHEPGESQRIVAEMRGPSVGVVSEKKKFGASFEKLLARVRNASGVHQGEHARRVRTEVACVLN